MQAVALFVLFGVYQVRYPDREALRSDGLSYYVYLPAAFIYHDLTFAYVTRLEGLAKEKSWVSSYEGQSFRISKMTAGVAVLQAPFFLAADGAARFLKMPLDGYSKPYQVGVALATLFYFLAGLWLIRSVLLHYFSDRLTAWMLVVPMCMTNATNYVIWEPSMSHIYSFFLVALMLWATVRWHMTFRPRHFFVLCLSLGMMALVRPTNLMAGLVPVLYGITDRAVWKAKWFALSRHPARTSAGLLLFFFPVSLQLALWKYQTGHWVFDSYAGEHFYPLRPMVAQLLLGVRSGWFVYTPVMLLVLPGIYFLFRRRSPFAWSLAIFLPGMLYLASTWWCWWYGGAFGMRPLIDFYPLFLVPVAACCQEWMQGGFRSASLKLLLVLFAALNLLQSYQYQNGLVHYADMSWAAYRAAFGKLTKPPGFDQLLDPVDIEYAKQGRPMRHVLRESDINLPVRETRFVNFKAYNGRFVCNEADPARLIADREKPFEWERFRMTVFDENRIILLGWNQAYISADSTGRLRGNPYSDARQAMFTLESLGDSRVALRAWNGLYVAVDSTGILKASSPAPTESAIFEIRTTPQDRE